MFHWVRLSRFQLQVSGVGLRMIVMGLIMSLSSLEWDFCGVSVVIVMCNAQQ